MNNKFKCLAMIGLIAKKTNKILDIRFGVIPSEMDLGGYNPPMNREVFYAVKNNFAYSMCVDFEDFMDFIENYSDLKFVDLF